MADVNPVVADQAGQIALNNDAGNRALRTFVQNIIIDVVVAVIAILVPLFQSANSFGELEWTVIIFSVAKTAVLTAFAFVMRRFLDQSALPTPQPPVVSGSVASPALTGNTEG